MTLYLYRKFPTIFRMEFNTNSIYITDIRKVFYRQNNISNFGKMLREL